MADVKAAAVNVLATANPDLWRFQEQRMEELLLRYPGSLATYRATVRDAVLVPFSTHASPQDVVGPLDRHRAKR